MGFQLPGALLWDSSRSRMAFLALCSFFLTLQYSRFLLRNSSWDSPGMGFGGARVLIGNSLVGEACAVFAFGDGVEVGFTGLLLDDLQPGLGMRGSMGERLMLDSGLSGGVRVARAGALSWSSCTVHLLTLDPSTEEPCIASGRFSTKCSVPSTTPSDIGALT